MVATVQWRAETSGTATFATDVTAGIRYKNANDLNVDNNDKLIEPAAAAFEYSFEKVLRLNVTVAATTDLENLQIKLTGSIPAGTTIFYGFQAIGSYSVPLDGSVKRQTTALTTTPASWNNAGTMKTNTGFWRNTAETGPDSDVLRTQLELDGDTYVAGPGVKSGFAITAMYDES